MTPDDPIYDPVRQIAHATMGISRTLDRLTTLTEQNRDLSVEVLKTQRAVAKAVWGGWVVAILGLLMILAVFWQCWQLQEQHTLMQTQTRALLQDLQRRLP